MKGAQKMKAKLRASWRCMLVTLLRLTRRLEDGLEARVRKMPAA